MYCDAHIHLFDYFNKTDTQSIPDSDLSFCASAHDPEEFRVQELYAQRYPEQAVLSFGIHPQKPASSCRIFLESLIEQKRIAAIGECGFDLFNNDFKATLSEQKTVWDFQVEMAKSSGLTLVIHCRKALDLIFADSRRLSKVSSVVFHGWSGSLREAQSLLDRGINAYFCAGKSLVWGDRSLVQTVAGLPVSRLLTETDAPYMQSRGESWSSPQDIRGVAAVCAGLSKMELTDFLCAVRGNFKAVYGIHP